MKELQVLIIDDERNAREEVKKLIAIYPELVLMGEAKNAVEAKELIEAKNPDLIFLDIQMPEKSGFELLESLVTVPQVIFTTAYDQYAVKAFEFSAIDYLMKPIREGRFAKAMEQVRTRAAQHMDDRIFVKDRNQYHFVSWKKVYLIESMDNYARLFFDDKSVFLKTSLNQLEQKLDEHTFFRIDRAHMINLNYVDKITTDNTGKLQITLKQGEVLDVSERQSVKLKKLLKV
ncbi:response regulator [Mucilaginibacter achroorhodeus]|uniref:Response regulator n=1 Tax=Mucilaginibacter achroorhodeus TaxID=2599294 RepID=A0A563U660_9SPHI|nr:response regulator transcription factor [Mucilaginibacter achroorhodeus]TWR26840.1 response regulator [Mucilaginibacter achroorhodeus]